MHLEYAVRAADLRTGQQCSPLVHQLPADSSVQALSSATGDALADPPYLIGEHPAPAERAMEKYATARAEDPRPDLTSCQP